MKVIEIYKNNKQIKPKKKKLNKNYQPIVWDFSSISLLNGNKSALETAFQSQKLESLSNG